jgi:type I restriction enzyme S subunit
MKSDWIETTFGNACGFQRGLTYSKGDEVESSSNIVLRANNVDLASGTLNFSELKFLNESIQIPKTKLVKKDSIILCTASGSKSHLGKAAFIDQDYGYAFGGFMGQITAIPEVHPRYLYHFMSSEAYGSHIAKLSDGVNINNLKFDDLRDLPFSYPSLPKQQRIVSILDEVFDSIGSATANTKKNLSNARKLFESYLQSIFENRHEGWHERELQDLVDAKCTLSYGIVQPGDEFCNGLPVVRPTDLTTKLIFLDGLKRIDPTIAASFKRTSLLGDELLLCVRGATGVVSVATNELKGGNVTRGIVPIRFNPAIIRQAYGYYALISNSIQRQIRAKTYGTALMQINIGDLRKVKMVHSELPEQDSLVQRLDELSAEVEGLESNYQQKLGAIAELRMV